MKPTDERKRKPPVKPTTLRIPAETLSGIQEIVQRTRRDFSSVTNEMLEEALRMRRIPGIVFADGPAGRRARIAGSGIDVFEVIRSHAELDDDFAKLQEAYPTLSEVQLRAALAYANAWPEDIRSRLGREAQLSPGEVHRLHPFTRPA